MSYMITGIGIVVIATVTFAGAEIILYNRKRRIKEAAYQLYESS